MIPPFPLNVSQSRQHTPQLRVVDEGGSASGRGGFRGPATQFLLVSRPGILAAILSAVALRLGGAILTDLARINSPGLVVIVIAPRSACL